MTPPRARRQPKQDVPTVEIVQVTQAMATEWLEKAKDDRNRLPSKRIIRNYGRDMVAGAWRLTGEAIKFGTNGALLDGRQRLEAIKLTGATVELFVMHGVDPEAQAVMDTGRKRSAADDLAISGETNTSLLASTIKLALGVEAEIADPYRGEPTHSEIRNFLADNPDVRSACDFARPLARRADCPATVAAYTYWVLARIERFEAASFWIGLADKTDLKGGDPILALSNRFAEIRRARQTLPKNTYLSLIYRAWNARRRNQEMRMIRVNSANGGLIPPPKPI